LNGYHVIASLRPRSYRVGRTCPLQSHCSRSQPTRSSYSRLLVGSTEACSIPFEGRSTIELIHYLNVRCCQADCLVSGHIPVSWQEQHRNRKAKWDASNKCRQEGGFYEVLPTVSSSTRFLVPFWRPGEFCPVLHELDDYLDPNFDMELKRRLESHVRECRSCFAVVDTTLRR
jgi:hypothetical protein